MKNLLFLLILGLMLAFSACSQKKENLSVCFINKTGEVLSGCRILEMNVVVPAKIDKGETLCEDNVPDGYAKWATSVCSPDYQILFAKLGGKLPQEKGKKNDVEISNSDIYYDFRDKMIGDYKLACRRWEISGTDTLNFTLDTLIGQVIKGSQILSLKVEVPAFFSGNVSFSENDYDIQINNVKVGQINPYLEIGFGIDSIQPNGHIIRKGIYGKKL